MWIDAHHSVFFHEFNNGSFYDVGLRLCTFSRFMVVFTILSCLYVLTYVVRVIVGMGTCLCAWLTREAQCRLQNSVEKIYVDRCISAIFFISVMSVRVFLHGSTFEGRE